MTKVEQMRTLINAGLYNLNSPGIVQELRNDFYANGSEAKTPEKLVQKMRKEKNAAAKAKRTKVKISFVPSNMRRLDAIKRLISRRRPMPRVASLGSGCG